MINLLIRLFRGRRAGIVVATRGVTSALKGFRKAHARITAANAILEKQIRQEEETIRTAAEAKKSAEFNLGANKHFLNKLAEFFGPEQE